MQRLDVPALRQMLAELEAAFGGADQSALAWLEESFNDAAEDADEDVGRHNDDDDDPEAGSVPLVPFNAVQRDAMESPVFCALLAALGLQPPVAGAEMYWRIPQRLSGAALRMRARLVAGTLADGEEEDVDGGGNADGAVLADEAEEEEDEGHEAAANSEAESEEDYDFEANRRKLQARQQQEQLIYNASDDEAADGDLNGEAKRPKLPKSAQAKKKFDIFDMVLNAPDDEDRETDVNEAEPTAQMPNANSDDDNDEEEVVNVTRKRNVIVDSDDDDDVANGRAKKKRERSQDSADSDEAAAVVTKRKRTAVIDDDDDDE